MKGMEEIPTTLRDSLIAEARRMRQAEDANRARLIRYWRSIKAEAEEKLRKLEAAPAERQPATGPE